MSAQKTNAWSAGKPVFIGLFTLIVLIGGFGFWAVAANISGAIVASGQIQVEQNRQVVQHPDGGVIEKIMVREGDLVSAEDVLITLDPTRLASELTVVEGQLYEYLARRGRLEAERDESTTIEFDSLLQSSDAQDANARDLMEGQQRLFTARRETLAQNIEQLNKRRLQILDQIKGLLAQQDAMQIQLGLILKERESQQTLFDKGLAQISRILALQREEARMFGVVGELTAQKAQAEGRITELDIQILQQTTARREEAITALRDLQFNEMQLREKRRALKEQLARLEIRAPVSGVVYGLRFFAPRSVVRPADPVLFLIPQDRPLIIAAKIETINRDEVFVGQEVSLRFASLDTRTTPELRGRVVRISPDAFTDENSGVSFYNSEIVLLDGEIEKLPEGTVLTPGMPVQAFIRTNDRSPLAYLIKPFADYFAKAWRET